MAQRVLRSITELGPLSELLARRDVEEVFVEGARVTYLDTDGRLRGLAEPTTEEENRQIVDRLLAATERQLNAKHPLVQARVLDGTARLTAAIEPVADRLSATVRRYTVRDVTLDALVTRDAMTAQAADFLWATMQLRGTLATRAYGAEPDVAAWANSCALNPARIEPSRRNDPAVQAAAARLADRVEPGLARMAELAHEPLSSVEEP